MKFHKPKMKRYKWGKYASVKLTKKGAVEVKLMGKEILSMSRSIPIQKLPKTIGRIYERRKANKYK